MAKKRKKDDNASYELAVAIAELCLTKKAEEVVLMDLRNLTTMSDFFVICSGQTDKQVKAIADAVTDGLAEYKVKPWHKEGMQNAQWILLDFVDVVVHIFLDSVRIHYNLEQLWGDAEITTITDTAAKKEE